MGAIPRWDPRCGPETIRRQAERSLELLRIERIDLLQLHVVDPAVPIEDSVGAIVDLQAESRVRLIGVSNVNVGELERARAVGEIASVQNRYSLGDRRSEDVLAFCERAGIAFLPCSPSVQALWLERESSTLWRGPSRNPRTGGLRLAPPALARHAADTRHLIGSPPRRERGRGGAPPLGGGVGSLRGME